MGLYVRSRYDVVCFELGNLDFALASASFQSKKIGITFLKPLCDCESRREAFFVPSNKIETPIFAFRRNKNDKTEKIWQRFNLLQISFSPLKEVT